MAKKSSVIKNNKRKALAKKYFATRRKLRELARDLKASDAEKWDAQVKLQKLRRDTSALRVRSRCSLTGRPRGNYQKFGLSRMSFRQLALLGRIPGVTKASW